MNKILTDYYAARKIHDESLKELDEKAQHIVDLLVKFFRKGKHDYWWAYDYYDADGESPLPQHLEEDIFPLYISEECASRCMDYSQGIPLKFFDWNDEQILDYLSEEAVRDLKIEKEEEEKKRQKKEKKDAEKKALKSSAISKLSPAERKALDL